MHTIRQLERAQRWQDAQAMFGKSSGHVAVFGSNVLPDPLCQSRPAIANKLCEWREKAARLIESGDTLTGVDLFMQCLKLEMRAEIMGDTLQPVDESWLNAISQGVRSWR